MTEAQQPAADWYPDPAGDTTKLRYWDGTQWTDQLKEVAAAQAPEGTSAQAAVPAPVQPVAPAPAQTPMNAPVGSAGMDAQYTNQPAAYVQQMPAQNLAPAKDTSSLAIISLVLGIVGPFAALLIILFGYVCGILAIVLGVKAMKSKRRTMAIVGIVLGILGIVIAVIFHVFATLSILNSNYYF